MFRAINKINCQMSKAAFQLELSEEAKQCEEA